jgi:hypothetical protein
MENLVLHAPQIDVFELNQWQRSNGTGQHLYRRSIRDKHPIVASFFSGPEHVRRPTMSRSIPLNPSFDLDIMWDLFGFCGNPSKIPIGLQIHENITVLLSDDGQTIKLIGSQKAEAFA